MSQNKTVIPGLSPQNFPKDASNLYACSFSKITDNSSTESANMLETDEKSCPLSAFNGTKEDHSVVGFLYSISRNGKGEYWPLCLGDNTIGRSPSSKIQLNEASVSNEHAILRIRKDNRTQKLIALVQDKGSTNGTLINNNDIGFDIHECINGDVLTIGISYRLVVILINVLDYGLSISEDFIDYKLENGNFNIPFSDSTGPGLENASSNNCQLHRDSGTTNIDDLDTVADNVRCDSQENMSELVFNPLSGEFETTHIDLGTTLSVTEMTGVGFAGPSDAIHNEYHSHEPIPWYKESNKRSSGKTSFWSRLFGKKDKQHSVYSSVFAPAEVSYKQHLIVQVYLHLKEETEKVKELAFEADKSTERRGYEPLEVKLKKGDNVEIELNINGNSLLYNSRKSVTWQGSFVKRSFDYLISSDIDVYELSCSVNVFVNGAVAGEMIFITNIVDTPRKLNTNIIAKPTKKLFISYSHKDIKSAERIAKIHEALGIDVFFDKHRLKAGYIYSEEISRFIQTADTFVLCWSENAAESDYVEKERKEALSLAYPQTKPREQASLRIHPYNIEPHATPPADMIEHYHFEEL